MKAGTSESLHLALIRGINVGRAKRVAMADLKRIVERLGYTDVRTLLNSGNVLFRGPSAKDAAERIERGMARLGVAARVVVLSAAELATIVKQNSLAATGRDPTRLMVAIPIDADPASGGGLAPLRGLGEEDWHPDAFALGKKAAYFWCPQGMLESRLANAIVRVHGGSLTVRNWATITKLHALVRGPA